MATETATSRPLSAVSNASNASASPRTSPTPTPCGPFEQNFRSFARFGDSKNPGDVITLSSSDKWFKQAGVIDGKKVSTVDTGIYFKQIAKAKKALNLKEYNQFLERIATNKKIELDDIKNKLSNCGPPATSKTTTAANSGAVARLTDHTKYTGTHKQRFDETGKGRGKAGREDIKNGSGYVQGFNKEGTKEVAQSKIPTPTPST